MHEKDLAETVKATIAYGLPLAIDSDLATLRAWLDEAYGQSGFEEDDEASERRADTQDLASAWAWVRGYVEPFSVPVLCRVWVDTYSDDPALEILIHVTTYGNDDHLEVPPQVAHHMAKALCKMRGIAAWTIETTTDEFMVRDHMRVQGNETRTAEIGDYLAALR